MYFSDNPEIAHTASEELRNGVSQIIGNTEDSQVINSDCDQTLIQPIQSSKLSENLKENIKIEEQSNRNSKLDAFFMTQRCSKNVPQEMEGYASDINRNSENFFGIRKNEYKTLKGRKVEKENIGPCKHDGQKNPKGVKLSNMNLVSSNYYKYEDLKKICEDAKNIIRKSVSKIESYIFNQEEESCSCNISSCEKDQFNIGDDMTLSGVKEGANENSSDFKMTCTCSRSDQPIVNKDASQFTQDYPVVCSQITITSNQSQNKTEHNLSDKSSHSKSQTECKMSINNIDGEKQTETKYEKKVLTGAEINTDFENVQIVNPSEPPTESSNTCISDKTCSENAIQESIAELNEIASVVANKVDEILNKTDLTALDPLMEDRSFPELIKSDALTENEVNPTPSERLTSIQKQTMHDLFLSSELEDDLNTETMKTKEEEKHEAKKFVPHKENDISEVDEEAEIICPASLQGYQTHSFESSYLEKNALSSVDKENYFINFKGIDDVNPLEKEKCTGVETKCMQLDSKHICEAQKESEEFCVDFIPEAINELASSANGTSV